MNAVPLVPETLPELDAPPSSVLAGPASPVGPLLEIADPPSAEWSLA